MQIKRVLMLGGVGLAGLVPAGISSTLLEVPSPSTDGQALDPLSPGLGAQILAIPGSTWLIGVNDNYGNSAPGVGGDFDFQDVWAKLVFNLDGTATLTYISRNSADLDFVQFLGGEWLAPGQSETQTVPELAEVVAVHALDASDGLQFETGPAAGNPGDVVYGWVAEETPEPSSWILTLFAVIWSIFWGRGLRRSRNVQG